MSEDRLEQLGKVVRLDPSRIDRRTPFTSLGVDSLASLELRNRIEASLGLQLSAALLFTYATPLALAGHLLRVLDPNGGAQGTSAAAEVSSESRSPGAGIAPGPVPESAVEAVSAEDAHALQMLQDFEEYLR